MLTRGVVMLLSGWWQTPVERKAVKNIRFRSPSAPKLMPRWVGPLSVTEGIGTLAYRLELPASWQMHPVFHVVTNLS